MSKNRWTQSEKNDTVATKRKLWEPIAERVGGFDLDPASGCEPAPIAETRYTKAEDGLSQPWFGTVWLNPPFSEKDRWYKRLADKYENGDVDCAVAIGPTDVSTDWFHNWFSTADVLCFLDGRGWFYSAGNKETFATEIGVWNPTDELIRWLQTKGTVVKPIREDAQTTLL